MLMYPVYPSLDDSIIVPEDENCKSINTSARSASLRITVKKIPR